MKRILLALLVSTSLLATAQTAIPEFKNKVMVLTKNNTLESMESTTLVQEVKGKFGGAKVYMKTDGEESSYKFNQAAGNRFIVKLDAGVDPESVTTCYVFEIGKNSRRISIGNISYGSSKSVEIPILKLNFSKVEDGVYIITPNGTIGEGEYIFFINQQLSKTVGSDIKGFSFSVPAKG